jgi:protein-disulfide isomerase
LPSRLASAVRLIAATLIVLASAVRLIAATLIVLAAAGGAPVEPRPLDVPAAPSPPSPRPDHVRLRLAGGFGLGSPRAPVVMVEFGDYQCPFCRRYQERVFPDIKTRYIDTGKVRYVVRDLPLDGHRQAFAAAEAARCAGAQGKFWPMREALGAHRRSLSPQTYSTLAAELGLALPAFEACRADHRFASAIRADMAAAAAAGIDRTPAFVIGRPAGGAVSGIRVFGASSFGAIQPHLEETLRAR